MTSELTDSDRQLYRKLFALGGTVYAGALYGLAHEVSQGNTLGAAAYLVGGSIALGAAGIKIVTHHERHQEEPSQTNQLNETGTLDI